MIIPKSIFKYQKIDINCLKNLNSQSLYMSSPLYFNDPYESALSVELNQLSDSDIKEFLEHYSDSNDIPLLVKMEMLTKQNDELREILFRVVNNTLINFKNNYLKSSGVSCFTETKENLLMWSHYSDSSKGLCFEFDTSFKPFENLKKVTYSPELPKINILSVLINEDYEHVIDLYCTKSDNWEYEKEWRLLHKKVGTLFKYDPNSLKSIYFGPRIEPDNLDLVSVIVKNNNPSVKLLKGKLSNTKFKIEFEPIEI